MISTPMQTDPAYVYTFLRLVAGIIVLPYGMQKLFGWPGTPEFGPKGISSTLAQITSKNIPKPVAWLVIVGQSFGSIALLAGFLGRIAAGELFIIFTGALIVHLPDGWAQNWFGSKKGEGIEYFILLLAVLLVIVLNGSGALSILSNHNNVEVLMEEACQIDVDAQTVGLKSGIKLPYDFLIVATGSKHSYFGNDEWAGVAPGLKTIEDATEIRRRVLLAYELAERQMVETGSHAPLKFVVIGGGPTGVELAGAISDIANLYMLRDFRHIDTSSTEVCILEGSTSILAAYPEELRKKAAEQLEALGVQVRTGFHVTDVQPGYVMVGSEKIESACTLWAAGVQGSPLGKMLGVDVDKRGRVPVDQFLNPQGLPNVFVCGDLAYLEQDGTAIPGVAQPAMQMGVYVGRRIKHLVQAPELFKNFPSFRYFDKGDIATIGRKAAVAKILWPFRANWSGLLAWLTWMGVHIFFLIGFRNRVSVFASWASTYIRLREGVRLIVGSRELPGWDSLSKETISAPETEVCPTPAPNDIESSRGGSLSPFGTPGRR